MPFIKVTVVGEGMAALVKFQILGNSALSGDMFQANIQSFQRRYRKDLSRILGKQRIMPILLYSVLFKDYVCNRKKFYRKRYFRLLTDTANLSCSIRSLCQFLIIQFGQIGIRQSRKKAEQKHIPCSILTLLLDFADN